MDVEDRVASVRDIFRLTGNDELEDAAPALSAAEPQRARRRAGRLARRSAGRSDGRPAEMPGGHPRQDPAAPAAGHTWRRRRAGRDRGAWLRQRRDRAGRLRRGRQRSLRRDRRGGLARLRHAAAARRTGGGLRRRPVQALHPGRVAGHGGRHHAGGRFDHARRGQPARSDCRRPARTPRLSG